EVNKLGSNNFVQNSYILMIGYLLSSIISTIGSILVVRLIPVKDYGLITIAFILPSILIPMGELGLNYASINFIARKMKENDLEGVRNVIKINMFIKIIVGICFTFFIAYFSVFIAKEIYNVNDERIYFMIQLTSIGVISIMLYEAINSFFIGAQKMRLVQFGTILNASLRTSMQIILIFLGFTLIGPILGFVIPPLIVVVFYLFFLKRAFNNPKDKREKIDWKELSRMIKYGYPLLIFSIIAGIQGQIFILILSIYGYLNEVSFFHVAVITAGIISILNKAISFSLFPIFSKMEWTDKNEQKTLIDYFQFSVKFGTLLIVPVTILLILFSQDIFPTVFGKDYREASPFISTYFLMFLLVAFGSLTIPAFFNGQKQTKYVLYITLVELISGVIFALILISYFGAIGLIFGIVLGSVLSVIYGYLLIRIKYGKGLFSNLKNVFSIFLIAILLGIVIFYLNKTFISLIPVSNFVIRITILAISFIIYGILFLFLIGIFSLINIDEINFLVKSFEKFPIINKILTILAKFEIKLINLKNKIK
ncbi:MAG: oligosaccharide flippase family protein, partial [Promethearchaeota archaeon]